MSESNIRSTSTGRRDTSIPRRPLLWMAAALLFTLPPFFDSLAIWVPWLFLVSLALKFWMEPRGYRLRSIVLKLLLVGIALTAVFSSYGSVRGVEAGISLLVILMSLKILEAHTAREFRVMVLIGWMLCLCGFFLSQDFATALCLLIAFALLVVALIQFHRGTAPDAIRSPVGMMCKLLLQALPLVVLFFVLFPESMPGSGLNCVPSVAPNTGFSDRLSPGSIAALANSSEIAFRAEFPGTSSRPAGPMYWRGVVMWRCNGMEWRAPYAPRPKSSSSKTNRTTAPSQSTVEREGNSAANYLTSEQGPLAVCARSPDQSCSRRYARTWRLSLHRPADTQIAPIRCRSSELRQKEISTRERAESLEVPDSITPAVRDLAHSWTVGNHDSRSVVSNALQFFRTQGFSYSLTPGEYNNLDEFLFRRRVGFCEHYATSFATLMRLAGIPARVVVGYLGGEYNDSGRFFLIRQADTHAWCEVWLPENGWTRVDPTSVVAPGRASFDLTSFLEIRTASDQTGTRRNTLIAALFRSGVFTNLRFFWQTLSYEWDTRLLAFDADVQDVLLTSMGMDSRGIFFSSWKFCSSQSPCW